MPIESQCEHCGFAYVSKDEMAGKKVRCRNCGQVFAIRRPGGNADSGTFQPPFGDSAGGLLSEQPDSSVMDSPGETRQMPAVTKYESNMSGGVGSAKSHMQRTGDAEMFDFAGPQPGELTRPSVPFSFPYAGDLDDWLPRIVPIGLVGWFFYSLWSWRPYVETGANHPGWAGLIPIGLLFLLLLAFWVPIFAGALRKVATAMNFSLPTRGFVRALCLASLPFALGGLFWLAGESLITMGIGLFIGTALAAPAAWFLYRLKEAEIAHAAIALAFATLLAAALTVGAMWGGNYALNKAMASAGKAQMFARSPMGPDLLWEVGTADVASTTPPARTTFRPPATARSLRPGEGAMPPIAPQPDPTVFVPPTPSVTDPAATARPGVPMPPPNLQPTGDAPAQQPAAAPDKDPFENHPVLANGRYLGIKRPIQDIVHPLAPSNYFAVVSPSADPLTQDLYLYSIEPLEEKARAPFASTVLNSGYALSADGRLLVRITHFGDSAAVQVYDFQQSRVIANHRLGAAGQSEPRLLGFIDNKTVMCEWRNLGGYAPFELGALDLGNMQFTTYAMSDERHSDVLMPLPEMKSVAAVGLANDNTVSLRFWQPSRRDDVRNRMTRIFLMDNPGAYALSPTGIAANSDGSQFAVTYEESGQLQLIVCKLVDRRWVVQSHIFAGGLGLRAMPRGRVSNRLTWLPGTPIVVYGQLSIDTESGKVLGTMDAGAVIGQQLISDRSMQFILNTPQGIRLLQADIRKPTGDR